MRGILHLQLYLLIPAIVILILLASPIRRYIYVGYQNIGPKIGLTTNNIATDEYVEWIKSQPDELEADGSATFLNKEVKFADIVADSSVLGESSADNKWIEIDLSEQVLNMREGDNIVGRFLVSTGKWSRTPTGTWRIWTKLRYTRMRGGSKALGTYYNLPNVPYTMYYYQGYGIHGAYWHNNFGHPMSHGCVNMKPEEAGIVFNWASVGTPVTVHQ